MQELLSIGSRTRSGVAALLCSVSMLLACVQVGPSSGHPEAARNEQEPATSVQHWPMDGQKTNGAAQSGDQEPVPHTQSQTNTSEAIQTPNPAASSEVEGARVEWDKDLSAYQYCKYEGDCGDDKECMDRGDRVFMCMGNGNIGAPCVYRHHCHTGLLCSNRGDSLNVCIGKPGQQQGAIGAPCNVDSSCQQGLVCTGRRFGGQSCQENRR